MGTLAYKPLVRAGPGSLRSLAAPFLRLLHHLIDTRWRNGEQRGCLPHGESAIGDEAASEFAGVFGEVAVGRIKLGSKSPQPFGLLVHLRIARLVMPLELQLVLRIVGQVSGQDDDLANVAIKSRQAARGRVRTVETVDISEPEARVLRIAANDYGVASVRHGLHLISHPSPNTGASWRWIDRSVPGATSPLWIGT